MAVLQAERNPFGGVVVDQTALPRDPARFAADLAESIEAWRAEAIKVAWLQLPVELAALVPVAVQAGFIYHHATEAWLELTLSIQSGSYIPPFATHYIGAGGVVINDARELLVIQERHHRRRHFKLPGGALHPGEHIAAAVIREVKEETGIDTEFENLVCFRHWHGYRYGKSDIYFVTRLRPLSFTITLDPDEIAECRWMPLDEYLGNPDTHPFNRRIVRAALDLDEELIDRTRSRALRPGVIPDYGTPETHELFFPGR